MKKFLCGVAVMTVATAALGVTGAHADSEKRVFNGMKIRFSPLDNDGDGWCTIGAVGTDDYGRRIAISAGHCPNTFRDKADVEHPEDSLPVYDNDDRGFGPIGYIRYFKQPDGDPGGHPTRDYMIIELVQSVQLSSQGPYLKQTGEMKAPNGPASPNALSPALDTERLMNATWTYNNEIVVGSWTGIWYSRVTDNSAGIYQSWAKNKSGDSGGPVIWHVPGSAYPTAANPRAEGPWAGITKADRSSVFLPNTYTSSANILADLRKRDTNDPADVFGAGFEVTTNP